MQLVKNPFSLPLSGLLLVVMAVGCEGDNASSTIPTDEVQTETANLPTGCAPEHSTGCFCDDGSFGTHTCDSTGDAYGPCDCTPGQFVGNESSSEGKPEGGEENATEVAAELGDEIGDEASAETGDEISAETGDEISAESGDEASAETGDEVGEETGDEVGEETGDEVGEESGTETSDESNTESVCVPDCAEKDCGDDGCGSSCGSCDVGQLCSEEGLCLLDETDSCEGKCGMYDPVAPCQCDVLCQQYGDCCTDYLDLCSDEEGGEIGDETPMEEGGDPPGTGACDNSADLAAYESPVFDDAYLSCTSECITAPDPGECLAQCLPSAINMSNDCATCFGDLLNCVIEECPEACLQEDGEDCESCLIANGCEDDFLACSGLPEEEPPTGGETGGESGGIQPIDGACTNPEDQVLVDAGTADEVSSSCATECLIEDQSTIKSCAQECILSESGLTDECALCYSAYYVCSVTFCFSQCLLSPEACDSCMADNGCASNFNDCAGFVDEVGPLPKGEIACDDGVDNDSDGLIDCDDTDCAQNTACVPEQSCNEFYLCLAEEWCDCTMDVDCPETADPAFADCQVGCFQNSFCVNTCMNKLTPKTENELDAYMSCTSLNCAGTTNDSYYNCVIEHCASEYSECFYVGTEECSYFYFECAGGCDSNQDCLDECIAELSPTAFLDAIGWDDCRIGLCDGDGDGAFDSEACQHLSNYFACADEANSCFPDTLLTGGSGCATTMNCVLVCDPLDDLDCLTTCILGMGSEQITETSALFTCAISTCGTGSGQLTNSCVQASLQGACAQEYAACQ